MKGNVFSNGVRRGCCIVLGNLFVCGVAQVVIWLEDDWVVSSPWELLVVSSFVKIPFPPAWGREILG